jgi:hypothetical protein
MKLNAETLTCHMKLNAETLTCHMKLTLLPREMADSDVTF